jgi:rhodanese-related sulfurtransferase
MKKSFAVVGLLAVVALGSRTLCAQDEVQFADPTVQAAVPVQTIAPADVLKMIQSKDVNVVLVDTQPVDGYAAGHILGAVNYPWVMQIKKFPIDLPRNKTLIMYGSCPNDTSDMVSKLAQFGYFNVKIMDGGWYKWQQLKYPSFIAPTADEQQSLSQLSDPVKSDKAK